jgi:hypothetical protein
MRRRSGLWLAAAAALLLWCSACAGILAENVREDGQSERVRLGSSDKWSTWDRNATKQNESLILLKQESTF